MASSSDKRRSDTRRVYTVSSRYAVAVPLLWLLAVAFLWTLVALDRHDSLPAAIQTAALTLPASLLELRAILTRRVARRAMAEEDDSE